METQNGQYRPVALDQVVIEIYGDDPVSHNRSIDVIGGQSIGTQNEILQRRKPPKPSLSS